MSCPWRLLGVSGLSAGGVRRVSSSPAQLMCNRLQTQGLGARPDHRAGAQHPGLGNVGGEGGHTGDGAIRGGPRRLSKEWRPSFSALLGRQKNAGVWGPRL